MDAKTVEVKGKAFHTLAEALLEWQQDESHARTFYEAVDSATESEPSLKKLKRQSENILVTYAGGRWSQKDFFERINSDRFKNKFETTQQFRAHLKREIGLTIRNDLLATEAISKGLRKSDNVQSQLHAWRDKWVYQEMRQKYMVQNGLDSPMAESLDSTGSAAQFAHKQLFLKQELGLLREANTVRVYEKVLDSISVTEFQKSRWATLFVYKNDSKRLAIPTVDPALGF